MIIAKILLRVSVCNSKTRLVVFLQLLFHRHIRLSDSCGNMSSRSACSPTATGVYFTPSDVRARLSVATMRLALKTLPWQPRHVTRTLESRRLELREAGSCLTRSWMFSRRWLPSLPASWYFGLRPAWPTFYSFWGFVRVIIIIIVIATLVSVDYLSASYSIAWGRLWNRLCVHLSVCLHLRLCVCLSALLRSRFFIDKTRNIRMGSLGVNIGPPLFSIMPQKLPQERRE